MHIPSKYRLDLLTLETMYVFTAVLFIGTTLLFYKEHSSSFGLLNPRVALPENQGQLIFAFNPDVASSTHAKAFVVYDVLGKKVVTGFHENEVLPLASVTKLMTAVTAHELATSSMLVTITPDVIDAGYDIGLKNLQVWRLGELTKYMLVFSSNDAANAIAKALGGQKSFVEHMNEIAQREKFSTLYFTNPHGLDSDTVYGGEGSPLDVARLMAYAYKTIPNYLDATTNNRVTVRTKTGPLSGVPNTNQEVNKFVGLLGSKTGFTEEAGGNLAIVFDVVPGRPFVIVVMGSSRSERFSDVEKLYQITRKALK